MLRQFRVRRVIVFFLIDWFGTLVALGLAAVLRLRIGTLPAPLLRFLRGLGIPTGPLGGVVRPWELVPPQVVLLVAVIWPCALLGYAVYSGRHNPSCRTELGNVFLAVCTATLCLAGVLYLTFRELTRLLFLLFFLLDLALLLGSRLALRLYRFRRGAPQGRPVLVVGAGPVGSGVVEQLRHFSWGDSMLVGYADDDPAKQGHQVQGLPVLGNLAEIPAIVAAHEVRDAVVALPLAAHEELVKVCRTLQGLGVRVHVVPDLFALSFPGASLDGFGGIPVVALGQPGIPGWQCGAKRAFDSAVAALVLLLVWPLLLLIAAVIKLDSRGPVIYRQRRVGKNGRPFTMLKFRSMRADARPELHQAYVTRLIEQNLGLEQGASGNGSLKMAGDGRVTRVGRFLRRTSLDELPQLWNVLLGEMSLVGPRPPLPYEVAVYQEWHKRRLEALPGITGLWQVEGRNRVSFDEMVRLDLEYIEHQSLGLDVWILLKTPWAALTGRGAG